MRFRIVSLLLLSCSTLSAQANEVPLLLRMDDSLLELVDPQDSTPTFIEADTITGDKNNRIEAVGKVELRNWDQAIRADRLTYDSQQLEATGNVEVRQGNNLLLGPKLTLNLEDHTGKVEKPQFFITETNGRARAATLHIQDKQHFVLDDASYSTCPPDSEAWQLRMKGLELDRERQVGIAHHARVEFLGLPILYFPWMDFSLNEQRKSGFLAPIFGSTAKGGTELTVPYYWNIAPNRDATIAPRIIEKRGLLLNNEFRYLEKTFSGEMNVDVLPDDRIAQRQRGHFALRHNQTFPLGVMGYVNLNRVSDNDYFRDLADAVKNTSQVNLPQEMGLQYGGRWWNAALRMQQYQTLQDPASPIVAPYARLPQFTLNAQRSWGNTTVNITSEYVDFSHETLISGKRTVINPSVSYALLGTGPSFITPKLGLHTTHYNLDKKTGFADATRTVPMFSIDSGLELERELTLFGRDHLHTLEPRLFYVYIPYREQAYLPNFDSAQADFSFVQMFTENRFFGQDRIGDANHLTLALSSRFLESESGQERLKFTMGQRFSLAKPRVYLQDPGASRNRSDMLMALDGKVTDAWSLEGEMQYDPNQNQIQRFNLSTHYKPEPGKVVNIGYRFLRDTLRHVDISTQWPLTDKWHTVARWNYSLLDNQVLEAIAGVEYNRACWSLRLVGQQFTTSTKKTNTGIFLQLELNDLIKVGSDPLGVLKQSVYGYTKLNESSK